MDCLYCPREKYQRQRRLRRPRKVHGRMDANAGCGKASDERNICWHATNKSGVNMRKKSKDRS